MHAVSTNQIADILHFDDNRYHCHKKWKDSQKTRAILLIFLLDLEIARVAVQEIHQNNENDSLQ